MKRLTRIVATLMLASAACTPALAADWVASEDKGRKVYNFRDGKVTALLVCDPEELWDPPSDQFAVKTANEYLTGTEVFISKNDQKRTLMINHGQIISRDKEGWNTLIDMLATPGPVTFEADGKTVVIDSAKGLASPCRKQ